MFRHPFLAATSAVAGAVRAADFPAAGSADDFLLAAYGELAACELPAVDGAALDGARS